MYLPITLCDKYATFDKNQIPLVKVNLSPDSDAEIYDLMSIWKHLYFYPQGKL